MINMLIWLLIIVLVLFSAFFSASEIALASANKVRLRLASERGDKASRRAEQLIEAYSRTLPTILIGNNLVNIAASSVATVLCVGYFGARGQTVAAVGTTAVLLIFGEILPKIVAAEIADKLVLKVSAPIKLFMFVFAPIVITVSAAVNRLSVLWTPKETVPTVTDDELITLLETIEEEGVFTEAEGELIKSAINFADVTAHEIQTPRVDMAAFDIADPVESLLTDDELMSYSRIPVYSDSPDNIVGILHTKQLLKAVISGEDVTDIRRFLKPPVYVHMTRNIQSILMEFRNMHSQMAVVVDEFGGTMGILTLEDILEEIVGEIYDESDEVEEEFSVAQDGSYEVDGGMNIHDMFEMLEYEPDDFESEYTTAGGWATEMLDRFPAEGDSFRFGPLDVTVTKAEAMRVEELMIIKNKDHTLDKDE